MLRFNLFAILIGIKNKISKKEDRAILDLTNKDIPVFKGFDYSVKEGLLLSKRSYSEFIDIKESKIK